MVRPNKLFSKIDLKTFKFSPAEVRGKVRDKSDGKKSHSSNNGVTILKKIFIQKIKFINYEIYDATLSLNLSEDNKNSKYFKYKKELWTND